jgi:hypothetical protein
MPEPLFVAARVSSKTLDELVLLGLEYFAPAAVSARELAAHVFGDPEPLDVQVREVERAIERLVAAKAAELADNTEEQRILRAEKLAIAPWSFAMTGGR